MKSNSFKLILAAVGLFVCISVMSSCNRGYGCPTNFSVDAECPVMGTETVSC